ncbi:MAG: ATP-binding cassette domain-containing protein [Clostridia bacterium]|nr:ATP-binding cassette domain-containing protein [Clostridia bacterium]
MHFGGLRAVDNISFSIKRGEVFGLVGESGCGKTTTGRAVIKLYNITGGNIYFKGKRISAGTLAYKEKIAEAKEKFRAELSELKKCGEKEKIAERRRALASLIAEQKRLMSEARYDSTHVDTNLITQIQMIFQDPIASLDPRMTVKEIVSEGLVIKGIKDKGVIDSEVYRTLELVGLEREHAGRYPHEFSGGQRQRIGVARSVIMKPELIIADEPVSALDVSIQAQVINLLQELKNELSLTVLFIAHDLSVVKYFSDRIGVMYLGKLVELADADKLFEHPLHPYTRSLLSAIPLPDPEYEKRRKRITYNPQRDHDYSQGEPSFREIEGGHFVLCNDAEEAKYKAHLSGGEG